MSLSIGCDSGQVLKMMMFMNDMVDFWEEGPETVQKMLSAARQLYLYYDIHKKDTFKVDSIKRLESLGSAFTEKAYFVKDIDELKRQMSPS